MFKLLMLLSTPLLLRPFPKFILFPPALPRKRTSFSIDVQRLWCFMRAKAHTAAEMTLGLRVLVPIRLRDGRV